MPESTLVRFDAVTGGEWRQARDLEMYRALLEDGARAFEGHFRDAAPIVTALLVGVQIRIWLAMNLPGVGGTALPWLYDHAPPIWENGESWRLVTMGLLHVELFHVGMNLLWLGYTGWNLERALGRANLLVLYFAAVVVGALASMLGSPETPSLGASGGVFGLVAASVVFGFARPGLLPERGRRLFGPAMLPYLVLMFWSGLANEGVDNWSHFGGLVTGLVLGLLLDPPQLQRRPGWNRRWHVGLATGIVAALLVFPVLGPRLAPLTDAEDARNAAMKVPVTRDRATYRSLVWDAPPGWRSGTAASGDVALVSPAGPRAWAVTVRSEGRRAEPREVADRWLERVRKGWPDAQVGDAVPVEVAGRPGLTLRVLLPPSAVVDPEEAHAAPLTPALVVELRVTTRGTYALTEVWQVEADAEARLAALRDRVRASVRWGDPEDLVAARADHAQFPNSRKARAALADALMKAGEVDEALSLRRGLVQEAPDDVEAAKGLLTLLATYPGLDPGEATVRELLATHPAPAIVVQVAHVLEASGQEQVARGLLDLAWWRAPGDRLLRRARTSRDMSTFLGADNLPWDLTTDPIADAPRSAADVDALLTTPLTLEAAAVRGSALASEREALERAAIDAITREDPSALRRLLLLRDGGLPADTAAVAALLDELDRALDGRESRPAPPWMPADLVRAVRDHPGALAHARAARADAPALEALLDP